MSTPTQAAAGPEALFQMLNAAQITALLTAGIQLGVFGAIAEGANNSAELARRIGCPERSTRILANALLVIGLLTKDGEKLRLSPLADAHLVPGKPMYMGDISGIFGDEMLWKGLSRFADAVRNGGTILEEHAETPSLPFWETFAKSSGSMSMAASAVLEGLLHDFIATRHPCRVLDVAAGSGIYGYTLLGKNPNVELTSLDWPNVIPETKQWGEKLGVDKKRSKYIEGNLFEVDFGGPYDVILMSHIYHHFDGPTCQALTKKVAQALTPGGKIAVHEFLTDGVSPAGIMFSVTMLGSTRKGEAYSSKDIAGWLKESGFATPSVHNAPGMPTGFVIAEKKS